MKVDRVRDIAEPVERLRLFFYILLRDEVPVGKLNRIVEEHLNAVKHVPGTDDPGVTYSCENTYRAARHLVWEIMYGHLSNVLPPDAMESFRRG